jgi:hypothetical protein
MFLPDNFGNWVADYNRKKIIRQIAPKLIERIKQDPMAEHLDLVSFLNELVKYATDNGDGLDWLMNQYKYGKMKLADGPKFKEVLTNYFLLWNGFGHRYIFNYKTLDAIERAIQEKINNVPVNQLLREIKEKEIYRIVDDTDIKILIPLTHRAACIYGKGTKWCISGERNDTYDWFEHYNKEGKIYIIILENDEKFLIHVECNQFLNSSNLKPRVDELDRLSLNEKFLNFLDSINFRINIQ